MCTRVWEGKGGDRSLEDLYKLPDGGHQKRDHLSEDNNRGTDDGEKIPSASVIDRSVPGTPDEVVIK